MSILKRLERCISSEKNHAKCIFVPPFAVANGTHRSRLRRGSGPLLPVIAGKTFPFLSAVPSLQPLLLARGFPSKSVLNPF